MPKVSVIVPVFGVEQYIERCARSLFEQTLDDIEYIFVDDCSTDNSISILEQVSSDYPQRRGQVVIHKMDHNSGQAAVRKWGMLNATGDYIIHCDSDDWVSKSMYETMWNKAQEGYDVVRCNFVRTDGETEHLCKQLPVSAYQDKNKLISYALIGSSLTSLCDKLIKRELIQCNSIIYPENNMQEDAAIVIQLFYYSHRVAFIKDPMYYYFNNSSSISRQSSNEAYLKRLEEVKSNTSLIFNFLTEKGIIDLFQDEVICRKYNVRSHLLWLADDSFYEKWKSIYPEIEGHILFCKKMYLYDKMMYLLVRTKMYRLLKDWLY